MDSATSNHNDEQTYEHVRLEGQWARSLALGDMFSSHVRFWVDFGLIWESGNFRVGDKDRVERKR